MLKYTIKRLLSGLVTLFGIMLISFLVIQAAPGDPAKMQIGKIENARVSARIYEQLQKQYHLDKPSYVQFGLWVKSLVTMDLGNSFSPSGEKVSTLIKRSLWPTMSVAILSILSAFIVSLPIGIYSAVKQGGIFDRVVSTVLYMLYSVPSYVMGILLILYVSVKWELLPFRGMHSDDYATLSPVAQMFDLAKHYILITFCFTFASLAYYARFVRQNLLEVIRQDYIRTARAKGVRESVVIMRHAFVNSLIPLITLLGMTLPALLGGSVILETMFNWPGLGRLYFESLLQRDYPVLMALNFFSACLVLVGTLLADLAYGLVDPRVSYE